MKIVLALIGVFTLASCAELASQNQGQVIAQCSNNVAGVYGEMAEIKSDDSVASYIWSYRFDGQNFESSALLATQEDSPVYHKIELPLESASETDKRSSRIVYLRDDNQTYGPFQVQCSGKLLSLKKLQNRD